MSAISVLAIRKLDGNSAVKAFVDIRLGGVTLRGCKIVQQTGARPWVALPSVKNDRGWQNVVEVSRELRERLTAAVLDVWESRTVVITWSPRPTRGRRTSMSLLPPSTGASRMIWRMPSDGPRYHHLRVASDGRTTLAKIIHIRGGRIVGKDPSPNVPTFDYTEAVVHDLRSLYIQVKRAAAHDAIAVRAKPKNPTGNRRIHETDGIEPNLEIVPRRWVAFDWDGLPLELQPCPNPRWSWQPDPLLEPWIGASSRCAACRRPSGTSRASGR